MNLEEALVYLEVTLLNEMMPVFLNVESQKGFIYIFIACEYFKHWTISERIHSIFELLKYDCPSILTEYPVIVEAFDDSELTELMKSERKAIARKK